MPAPRSENDREGGEADVDGKEVSERDLHPYLDVEIVVESGPGREGNDANGQKVERVYPSPSTPSIPHSGKPDGM
jgi:hypothetical protein